MELTRTARTILSVTALAWAIPLAQAQDKGTPRVGNAKFMQLDINRDGELGVTAKQLLTAHSAQDGAAGDCGAVFPCRYRM